MQNSAKEPTSDQFMRQPIFAKNFLCSIRIYILCALWQFFVVSDRYAILLSQYSLSSAL